MTSKFDSAVSKILGEGWTDYIPNFLAKPEYTHGWRGRARAAKDAMMTAGELGAAALPIPGTRVHLANKARKLVGMAKDAKDAKDKADKLKKAKNIMQGMKKTGRTPGRAAQDVVSGAGKLSLGKDIADTGIETGKAIIEPWQK